jgi:hypothetical protein
LFTDVDIYLSVMTGRMQTKLILNTKSYMIFGE